MKNFCFYLICIILASCSSTRNTGNVVKPGTSIKSTVTLKEKIPTRNINTKNVNANDVVSFAESLVGTPYVWAGTSPEKGFDCSGFIFYVFGRYKIAVPRSSKDFTNAGKEVASLSSKRGDLILFTGSDPRSGVVGHMGIITRNDNGILQFIHSASGSNAGVMISGMNSYFLLRYVKIIRVFK